jgi:hypothetical protein
MDFSASLTDQDTAAIKLLLHAPTRIFEQPFDFLLVDRVEQLRQETGDTILFCGVLIRCAIWSLGVTLGLLIVDQFREDPGRRFMVHRCLGLGARVHRRSSAAIGKVDDKTFALVFD